MPTWDSRYFVQGHESQFRPLNFVQGRETHGQTHFSLIATAPPEAQHVQGTIEQEEQEEEGAQRSEVTTAMFMKL